MCLWVATVLEVVFQCRLQLSEFGQWHSSVGQFQLSFSSVPCNIRRVTQWYPSVHGVNQWYSSGIPVYTRPASVHWLGVRVIACWLLVTKILSDPIKGAESCGYFLSLTSKYGLCFIRTVICFVENRVMQGRYIIISTYFQPTKRRIYHVFYKMEYRPGTTSSRMTAACDYYRHCVRKNVATPKSIV